MNELSKWHVIAPLALVALFGLMVGIPALVEGRTQVHTITVNSGATAIKYGVGWILTAVLAIIGIVAFNKWWDNSDF